MWIWFVAALAFVGGVITDFALSPRAWAEPAPVDKRVEPKAVQILPPKPAPKASKAPSAEALRLADTLMRPILEGITDRFFPQAGPQLLSTVDGWDGWSGWRPRPGTSRSDVERVLVAVLQEALTARLDAMIVAAAVAFEDGFSGEDLIATNAYFESPLGRSTWSKIIDYVLSNFDVQTLSLRPIPPGFNLLTILTPEEVAGIQAFTQTASGQQFSPILRAGLRFARTDLGVAFSNDSDAIEAEFRKRACKFAIAPACTDL